MSEIKFRNLHHCPVLHLPTRRTGDLRVHDPVIARGKGAKLTAVTSFEAIFTFDYPITCAESEVPEYGGVFMQNDGNVEVT